MDWKTGPAADPGGGVLFMKATATFSYMGWMIIQRFSSNFVYDDVTSSGLDTPSPHHGFPLNPHSLPHEGSRRHQKDINPDTSMAHLEVGYCIFSLR
jgi:hypothetical protein